MSSCSSPTVWSRTGPAPVRRGTHSWSGTLPRSRPLALRPTGALTSGMGGAFVRVAGSVRGLAAVETDAGAGVLERQHRVEVGVPPARKPVGRQLVEPCRYQLTATPPQRLDGVLPRRHGRHGRDAS